MSTNTKLLSSYWKGHLFRDVFKNFTESASVTLAVPFVRNARPLHNSRQPLFLKAINTIIKVDVLTWQKPVVIFVKILMHITVLSYI